MPDPASMDGYRYTACFEAPGGVPILRAYPDPITRGSPWTIGLGHTGPDVAEGTLWTPDQCWSAFYNDYAIARAAAAQLAGTSWVGLNDPRQAVLTDMAFNLGESGLSGFRNMLAMIRSGNWQRAHDHLLSSAYAIQVKSRASTNAAVLLSGTWPEQEQA